MLLLLSQCMTKAVTVGLAASTAQICANALEMALDAKRPSEQLVAVSETVILRGRPLLVLI